MRKLSTLFLVMLLSAWQLAYAAQGIKISGRIIDATTKSAVGYATVAILLDQKPVNAVAAAADGRFSMDLPREGVYTLSVSMVGYSPLVRETTIPREGLQLNDIALSQGIAMEGVEVKAQRPIVVSDAEKLSYSVEDDPQASGSTLEDVIRKVPQLSIDGDGNILLNGQSNYKVLLNGQSSAAFSNNLKEIIRSMPADQISRIEVITNPSMKYDAEGEGGIINLITVRKHHEFGYNGSLAAGFVFSKEPTMYNNSGQFSLQKGKFAMGLNGWFYDGSNSMTTLSRQETYQAQNPYNTSEGDMKNTARGGGASLNMSFQPDTLNLLTLNAWFWAGRYTNAGDSYYTIADKNLKPTSQFIQNLDALNKHTGGSVSLNYEHKFGREGHTLTFSDELEISPEESDNLHIYSGDLTHQFHQWSEGRTLSNTFQADYVNPLTKIHKLEVGMKHIYRHNTSPMTALQRPDAEGSWSNSSFSDLDYHQHIMALYAGYGFTLPKLSGRLGARMERTWNDAEAEDQDHERYSFENRQFNVVPYVSLTYIPKGSHVLSLSYTQRLNRPGIEELSPAVVIVSPTEDRYGNPALEAAIKHNLALKYSHFTPKWSLMLDLHSFISNNSTSDYALTGPDGVKHNTYSNDVRSRSVGFSTALSWRPSLKLGVSLSANGDYTKYELRPMNLSNSFFAFNQNFNVDFALWKEARFMGGETYFSGRGMLNGHSQSMVWYYMGLRQRLFKQKFEINFMVYNPFTGTASHEMIQQTPTHYSLTRATFRSRMFNLRLTWNFGKQNIRVKSTSRSIVNDDVESNRGGNQGGGMMGGGMQ